MSKKLQNRYITVFVPTYNGEKYLRELINSVLKQKLPKGYELEFLITDSGSTDTTQSILKKYSKKITLNVIPNKEFGHGKTRQQAAEKAKGEFILFLSQDATPSHERWIVDMIEPFSISDKVGCVFGRQIPRPDAVPTIKREVSTVFAGLGAPDSLVIHRDRSLTDRHRTNSINTFFSDVNSAVRTDLLKTTVPFRDVRYAEDQALAKDMQKNGYIKVYTPIGSVWHSNEYSVNEFYRRKFDEFIGLQESTDYKIAPSVRSLLFGWIRPSMRDWKFTLHDTQYPKRAKVKYLFFAVGYNFANELGKYNAAKYINNEKRIKEISLESSRKNHQK